MSIHKIGFYGEIRKFNILKELGLTTSLHSWTTAVPVCASVQFEVTVTVIDLATTLENVPLNMCPK